MIRDPLLEIGVAPESGHGGSTKLKYDKVSRWVFLLKIFLANVLLFFFVGVLGVHRALTQHPGWEDPA